MASDCLDCKQVVRPRQEAIQCDGCENWQHMTCGNLISRDLYRQVVNGMQTLTWFCASCMSHSSIESTRISSTADPSSNQSDSDLDTPHFNDDSSFNISQPVVHHEE